MVITVDQLLLVIVFATDCSQQLAQLSLLRRTVELYAVVMWTFSACQILSLKPHSVIPQMMELIQIIP